jgi:polar amino acid transport system substrate-binding protein
MLDSLVIKLQKVSVASAWRKFGLFLVVIIGIWLLIKGCNALIAPTITKVYHLARRENVYPLNMTGKERYFSAFSDDIVRSIAKEKGFSVDLTVVQADDIFQIFESGFYDGVITMRMPGPLTRDKFLFSDPFFLLGPVVIARVDSSLTNIDQLKGKIIGIPVGLTAVSEIRKIPDSYIVTYDNYAAALENLSNNKIDAVLMDAWPAYVYTSGFYSDRLKIVTEPINTEGLRVVSYNDPVGKELIDNINSGLAEMKKNGQYKKLVDRWGLIDPENFIKR